MDYAASRFAVQGFHPTSVAEITEGLGVGKGVFYWYFGSKDELFLEILRDAHTELRRTQQRAIDAVDDPVQRIEAGIRATLGWFDEHRHLFTLFQFAATSERFAASMRMGQQVAVADTVRHVKEAMAEGRIAHGDPELLAHAMIGVIGEVVRTFVHHRDQDAGEVSDAAVRFCLHGLLGRD